MSSNKYIQQILYNGNILLKNNNYKGLFISIGIVMIRYKYNDQTYIINHYDADISNKDHYIVNIDDPNFTEIVITNINNYIAAKDYFNAFNCYIVNCNIVTDPNCRNVIVKYFTDYFVNNNTINKAVTDYINENWRRTVEV